MAIHPVESLASPQVKVCSYHICFKRRLSLCLHNQFFLLHTGRGKSPSKSLRLGGQVVTGGLSGDGVATPSSWGDLASWRPDRSRAQGAVGRAAGIQRMKSPTGPEEDHTQGGPELGLKAAG